MFRRCRRQLHALHYDGGVAKSHCWSLTTRAAKDLLAGKIVDEHWMSLCSVDRSVTCSTNLLTDRSLKWTWRRRCTHSQESAGDRMMNTASPTGKDKHLSLTARVLRNRTDRQWLRRKKVVSTLDGNWTGMIACRRFRRVVNIIYYLSHLRWDWTRIELVIICFWFACNDIVLWLTLRVNSHISGYLFVGRGILLWEETHGYTW